MIQWFNDEKSKSFKFLITVELLTTTTHQQQQQKLDKSTIHEIFLKEEDDKNSIKPRRQQLSAVKFNIC